MSKKKAHVIVERWQVGMFHKIRHIRCRCGWTAEHYNAQHLTALFKEHAQAAVDATPPVPAAPVVPDEPSLADLVYTEEPEHESYQSDKDWSPVVPPEPSLALCQCGHVRACHQWYPTRWGSCITGDRDCGCNEFTGSPVVPAATDEPACSTCNDTKTVVKYVGGNDVGYTYDAVCQDCPDPSAPAATAEAWAGMNLSDDERAGLLSALDDLHGPAATNEPALALSAAICSLSVRGPAEYGSPEFARRLVAALEANGYRIVKET